MAVVVRGLDRLKRKLSKIPDSVVAAVRKAMEKSASDTVSMMKSLVSSERVKATIGWTWGEPPGGSMVLGRVKSGSGSAAITIYAGSEATMVGSREQFQLAALIEFGTKPHVNEGIFKGSQHPGTKAEPFFYVAWRANRKKAKSAQRAALRKSVKAVAQGGA